MSNRHVIENVTIANVTRHGTSTMGNPTMDIHLTDGRTFRTSSNASVGYAASNYQPRHHQGVVCTVDLETTPSGRVVNIIGKDAMTLLEEKRGD